MPVIQVWSSAVLLGILLLHGVTAQSGMCDVPLRAGFMQVTDTTFPIGSIVDADLVFFRETLRFTEEEIDREREAAIDFFNQRFGLDYSKIEPDELGQRVLGNTTFRPVYFPYNATLVHNQWLLNGKSRTKCYQLGDGGFQANFDGEVRLFGEYGGEEGRTASQGESVLYGRDYLYDACSHTGIIFQTESITPIRVDPTDGWIVLTFRVRNRELGEGVIWGISRVTQVNSTTLRYESRQVYVFDEV